MWTANVDKIRPRYSLFDYWDERDHWTYHATLWHFVYCFYMSSDQNKWNKKLWHWRNVTLFWCATKARDRGWHSNISSSTYVLEKGGWTADLGQQNHPLFLFFLSKNKLVSLEGGHCRLSLQTNSPEGCPSESRSPYSQWWEQRLSLSTERVISAD